VTGMMAHKFIVVVHSAPIAGERVRRAASSRSSVSFVVLPILFPRYHVFRQRGRLLEPPAVKGGQSLRPAPETPSTTQRAFARCKHCAFCMRQASVQQLPRDPQQTGVRLAATRRLTAKRRMTTLCASCTGRYYAFFLKQDVVASPQELQSRAACMEVRGVSTMQLKVSNASASLHIQRTSSEQQHPHLIFLL